MNYIKQLSRFYEKAQLDPSLSPTQISLFMALFQAWNKARFANSIQITRDEIMSISKISSKATYHKCMTYLHSNHYIYYTPSFNPYKGSKIAFFPSPQNTKTVCYNEPVQILSTRPINEPINKLNNNSINTNRIITRANKNQKNEKSNEQAHTDTNIPPAPYLVEEYFIQEKSSHHEAQKFLNHYTANGWLVGGKTPMKDWRASARNWISNSSHFKNRNFPTSDRAKQLNTPTNKNYFEPL